MSFPNSEILEKCHLIHAAFAAAAAADAAAAAAAVLFVLGGVMQQWERAFLPFGGGDARPWRDMVRVCM